MGTAPAAVLVIMTSAATKAIASAAPMYRVGWFILNLL
jgi:hypothetical protein